MTEQSIEMSRLWARSLAPQGDEYDRLRLTLATVFRNFRERVGQLVGLISRDMRHYTIHDISHLDALWETADVVAGLDFQLNPAEAFVFGGAVLLHDAGMTLAAYPQGEADLMTTSEWADSLAAARRVFPNLASLSDNEFLKDFDAKDFVISTILRELHASTAERLIKTSWIIPDTNEQQYLLEMSDLREHFGDAIGLIAASHHWPAERISAELSVPLGAFPLHPGNWSVNLLKVALLLRCADAAHIDSRRAPRLLFALNRPTGISREHWRFQAKIAKLQIDGEKLLFTSTSSFESSEADSWQLAWDSIKLVEKELRDSNDILERFQVQQFAARGVEGASSPVTLSKYIKVTGWTPVLPNIQVSDVAHLARTLGGGDLYTTNFAPLRELLQNAADSIDARRRIDSEFRSQDGHISVKISRDDGSGEIILEVEDNGLGMSDQVLTGPLIDFGTSFWRSYLAKQEYPGLQSKFRSPRGRFGIGFFSAFMWSDDVQVISRPYHRGREDTKVLEFRGGLGRRPLLRPARADERLGVMSTRVRLRISDTIQKRYFSAATEEDLAQYEAMSRVGDGRALNFALRRFRGWKSTVALLTALLEIPVTVYEDGGGEVVNLPAWKTMDGEEALSAYLKMVTIPEVDKSDAEGVLSAVSRDGGVIGRAMLSLHTSRGRGILVYEKGIFIEATHGRRTVGFIEGAVQGASRERSKFIPPDQDDDWFNDQIRTISDACRHVGDRLRLQGLLGEFGKFDDNIACFVLNRRILCLNEVVDDIKKMKKLVFTLNSERMYADVGLSKRIWVFNWKKTDTISIITGFDIDETRLYSLIDFQIEAGQKFKLPEDLISISNAVSRHVLTRLIVEFGDSVDITTELRSIDDYSQREVLDITLTRR